MSRVAYLAAALAIVLVIAIGWVMYRVGFIVGTQQ